MALISIAVAAVLGALVALLGGHVFDERLLELTIGPITVGAVAAALVGRRRRWRVVAVVLVGVVGVFATVLVAGGSFSDVVPGVRSGPQRLLSTEWPSPVEPSMVATIALLVTSSAAISVVLAAESRWRLAPLGSPLVAAVTIIALGAPARPSGTLLVVAAVLALLVAVLEVPGASAGRDDRPRRPFAPDRSVAATVAVVAAVAALVAGSVAWADRADPRDTDEADVSAVLIDPVEATIALRSADPAVSLMSIDDRSVLSRPSMPGRWRTAAFDTYDGQRWVPDLELRPIGGRLALAEPGADAISYDVMFTSDGVDLVPFPGRPISVDRDVETDVDRVAVRLATRPSPGEAIRVDADVAPTGVTDEVTIRDRQIDDRAAAFTDRANLLADEGSFADRLARIARTMREQWQLDPQAPGAGQQQALLDRFVTDTQRGTREQFVTAFVLLARSIGVDARVAAGFEVPPEERGSRFDVRTDHAAIWPEVGLTDGTWVAYDPVPPREAGDADEPPPPPEEQSPAAAQPPIAPPVEDQADDDEPVVDERDDADGWGTWGTWVVRGAVVGGIALAPIALAVAAVLGAKWARRRRRLRAVDAAGRVRGAWANATDSFVDAGVFIAPAWTDDRIAEHAATVAPGAHHESRRLAAMSSAVTFGSPPRDDVDRLAADAVRTAERIDAAIAERFTRRERLRWRLSLRSLRQRTRSPVLP